MRAEPTGVYRRFRDVLLYPVPLTRAGAYILSVLMGCGVLLWEDIPWRLPGLANGLLAAATVIMAVRGERITGVEKVGWILLAFFFFAIETRTIYRDRKEQDAQFAETRAEETRKFREIADGLELSMSANNKHFDSSMHRMKDILSVQTGLQSAGEIWPPGAKLRNLGFSPMAQENEVGQDTH